MCYNTDSMTIQHWLHQATQMLKQEGITTARLDALILLEDATGKDRAWLLAHGEESLLQPDYAKLDNQLARRCAHEPLAYIRGKSEFYGREFIVTPATLQPRPETETIINLLKNMMEHKSPFSEAQPHGIREDDVIVDIGTGSGAISITTKLLWPHVAVYATEINQDALMVAERNAAQLNAEVLFYQGNLLEPLPETVSTQADRLIILANLPYVPDNHTINQAAMQEPSVAIFGGPDGLDLYRALFLQAAQLHHQAAYILTESLPFQHEALHDIARAQGYKLITSEDFIQVFKA